MRQILLATAAVAMLAVPPVAHADDATVQSLIGQLKPRTSTAPITTRGIRMGKSDATETTAPAPVAPARARQDASAAVVASSKHANDAPSADLNVLFASGSTTLTPSAVAMLRDLGRALTDPSMGQSHFLIEGHTDAVGDRMTNQVLSERRAAAVAEFLVSEFHISADRLKSAGLGKDRPVVPTPDGVAEPRNRRVHIVNLDG